MLVILFSNFYYSILCPSLYVKGPAVISLIKEDAAEPILDWPNLEALDLVFCFLSKSVLMFYYSPFCSSSSSSRPCEEVEEEDILSSKLSSSYMF